MLDPDDKTEDVQRSQRREAMRRNSKLRRTAPACEEPPPYNCIVCGREIDLCKCEYGE